MIDQWQLEKVTVHGPDREISLGHTLTSVIVHNLNVKRISTSPDETDAPLVVDPTHSGSLFF